VTTETLSSGARAGDRDFHRLLMEDMLLARRASERLWNLQRQGRITTIPPLTGQEATSVGVVRALDLAHDWIVPYYREQLGMAALGDEFLEQMVAYWRGHPDGGRVPDGVLCLPPQISLGSQIPQAAGLALGLRLRGVPGIVCAFIGDGATSEGDFYEGLNLAGVQHVPLLVIVVNNGWAISTPIARQTAAATLAAKAEAVGAASMRADGNDVLAVFEATRTARTLVTTGHGPMLLELVTYRTGAHTNSDDPSRYVPEAELAAWKARDPINLFRARLTEAGTWDDAAHEALVAEVEARLERIVDAAFARDVEPIEAFDHVSASGGTRFARQRQELEDRLGAGGVPDPAAGVAPAASDRARDDGDEPATQGLTDEGVSWRA
jgi:pyruvate dehydrogenase E1 component alpha subunit